MAEKKPVEIKCSKCGKTGVRIARFRVGTSGEEWICEECAEK